jgi:hypothetical protein
MTPKLTRLYVFAGVLSAAGYALVAAAAPRSWALHVVAMGLFLGGWVLASRVLRAALRGAPRA